jgi:hypothetical protein
VGSVTAYLVEARTVYGRTTYCVLSGSVTVARCDDRQAAHLVCSLLNTHAEKNGGSL